MPNTTTTYHLCLKLIVIFVLKQIVIFDVIRHVCHQCQDKSEQEKSQSVMASREKELAERIRRAEQELSAKDELVGIFLI